MALAAGVTVDSLVIDVKTSAGQAAKELNSLSSALTRLKTATAGGYSGLASLARNLKKVAEQIDTVDLAKVQALASMMHATATAKSTAGSIKIPKSVVKGLGTTGGGESTGDRDGLTSATKKAGKAADKASGKFGKFLESLKRVAVYRLIRTALKKISEALQTGMKNIYQYSMVTKTELAPTMDKIAVSTLYWKNSLGAVGGQLVQQFAPVLIKISDTLAEVNNDLAQMIAMLRGVDTYTKAKKIKEYAGAWAELNRELLGFDEINKLNGGGNGGVDYSEMFEEAVVSKGEAATTLTIVTAIGAALAAWKITSFIAELNTAKTLLGTIAPILGANAAGKAAGVNAAASGASGVLGAAAWVATAGVIGAAGAAAVDKAIENGAHIDTVLKNSFLPNSSVSGSRYNLYEKYRHDVYGVSDVPTSFGAYSPTMGNASEIITGKSGETSIDIILDSSTIGSKVINWQMGQKFRAAGG